MIKGILITTDRKVSVVEVDNEATGEEFPKSPQSYVKGWMEIVRPIRLPEHFVFICNEEGKLINLPENIIGSCLYQGGADYIAGDIVILKEGYGEEGIEFVDMSEDDLLKINNILSLLPYPS